MHRLDLHNMNLHQNRINLQSQYQTDLNLTKTNPIQCHTTQMKIHILHNHMDQHFFMINQLEQIVLGAEIKNQLIRLRVIRC